MRGRAWEPSFFPFPAACKAGLRFSSRLPPPPHPRALGFPCSLPRAGGPCRSRRPCKAAMPGDPANGRKGRILPCLAAAGSRMVERQNSRAFKPPFLAGRAFYREIWPAWLPFKGEKTGIGGWLLVQLSLLCPLLSRKRAGALRKAAKSRVSSAG